ncbi:MAG: L-ribulose-5-phosphate 3-epimerase [Clostridiales bacterium]|nr:L-ribulose-5-phosphate 3-epimerase [Clostridiales bacterium]
MLGNHLLGLYEKALPPELSWRERLEAARELGFDFVEISIDETDERLARLDMGPAERDALHAAIRDSGIPLQSMCLSAHRRFPFGSADASVRARAGEIMEKAVRFAREFGIRVIQLAGYDVYYEPSTPESLARFEDGLRGACGIAGQYQVMLAMEIMDTELMSSVTRYLNYKALLPSPWFTVYPDLGNLSAWGNDTLAELDLGRDQIVGVHVKDTLAVTADFPGKFKCVPFGSGCVDFPACFGRLERQGYRGPYMIEMWYQPGQDWRAEIASARDFVTRKFEEGLS